MVTPERGQSREPSADSGRIAEIHALTEQILRSVGIVARRPSAAHDDVRELRSVGVTVDVRSQCSRDAWLAGTTGTGSRPR